MSSIFLGSVGIIAVGAYLLLRMCVHACKTKYEAYVYGFWSTGMYSVYTLHYLKQVAHTRLPSVGFRIWSRFLVVSLQVTSHEPGCRLPLLSARPAVTLATIKRAATSVAAWWIETRSVWTVCLRLFPNSIAAAIWTQALILRLSPAC